MESLITVGIKNLTSTEHSILVPNVLTTIGGPQAMRQIIRFTNQTVVDKVPQDMLHLVDPHWLFLILLINILVSFFLDHHWKHEIFKLQVSVSTNESNVAQNSWPCNDRVRIYGMDWQWCCSVCFSDDTLPKNTKQSFSSKSGFLRLYHDDHYVASYGNKLLLRDLGVR